MSDSSNRPRTPDPEEVEILEISSSDDEVPQPSHRRFGGGNARTMVPNNEHREVVEISSDSEDSGMELLPRPPRMVTKPSRRRIPAIVATPPRPRTPDFLGTQEVDRLEHLIQQIKTVGNGSIAHRREPCRQPDSALYSLAPAWMQSILGDGTITSNEDERARNRTSTKIPRKRVAKRLDHERVVLDLVNIQ
ncbi:hypothetical protein PQX77_006199 [Marasmius sp. AFHP31]|nr:hypothetical protein PQX77_006199 [Marasmius sp. AFHP31]